MQRKAVFIFSLFIILCNEYLPIGLIFEIDSEIIWSNFRGPNYTCLLHLLTLLSTPPASPGNLLTDTSE